MDFKRDNMRLCGKLKLIKEVKNGVFSLETMKRISKNRNQLLIRFLFIKFKRAPTLRDIGGGGKEKTHIHLSIFCVGEFNKKAPAF